MFGKEYAAVQSSLLKSIFNVANNRKVRQNTTKRGRSIERLEDRMMMAADVVASLQMPLSQIGTPDQVVSAPLAATGSLHSGNSAALAAVGVTTNSSTLADFGLVDGYRSNRGVVGPSYVTEYSHRFVLDESAKVRLVLFKLSADLDLYIYDSANRLVAKGLSYGTTNEIIEMNLAAGAYRAVVVPYGSAQSGFEFSVKVDAAGDSIPAARNIGAVNGSRTFTGWVGHMDFKDYFAFYVPQTSRVSLRLSQLTANVELYLYNSAGQQIGQSEYGGTSNERVDATLNPGWYHANVASFRASSSNYVFSIDSGSLETPGFQIQLNMNGLTANQQAIVRAAANRWQQVIVGDLPSANHRGTFVDDLSIDVTTGAIDGRPVNGISVLAIAGYDAVRAGSRGLPYHGWLRFDSADIAALEREGRLYVTTLHEIGHALGIGTAWQNMGLVSSAGLNNPIFVGANATAAYNQIFGTAARGVPIENTGAPGTRDVHWRDTIFQTELMTGALGAGPSIPLSRVTVGSLADMGYSVNYAAADPYVRPAAALRSSLTVSSTLGPITKSTSTIAALASAHTSGKQNDAANLAARVNVHRTRSAVVPREPYGVTRLAHGRPTLPNVPLTSVDTAFESWNAASTIQVKAKSLDTTLSPMAVASAWRSFGATRS